MVGWSHRSVGLALLPEWTALSVGSARITFFTMLSLNKYVDLVSRHSRSRVLISDSASSTEKASSVAVGVSGSRSNKGTIMMTYSYRILRIKKSMFES